MAFREKITWVTLGTMILVYGFYFTYAALAMREGEPSTLRMLSMFGAAMVAQVVMIAAASAILAVRARGEAHAAADERDRAIARRGAAVAYYVLMVGMILVGVVMPFEGGGWRITNAALFALVVAEAVRYGLMVFSYRRGWHG